MRAYRLTPGGGIEGLTMVPMPDPVPGPGEVLIRVHATSLNYRDLILAKNAAQPIVPLSDGAGEVAAIGDGVTRFAVGDRVIATFFLDWLDGPATAENTRLALGGGVTDGMLAGDLTGKLVALGVALIHKRLHPALELVLIEVVGAAVYMQISVPRVTERAHIHALLPGLIVGIHQKFRYLVHRNHHVHLVKELGVGLDRSQERAARRPDFLLEGRGIDDEDVHGAGFLGDTGELLHLEVELILALTDEGDEDAGSDRLAVHIQREHLVAGEGGGGADDVGVHELDGLRVEVRELDGRHGGDAALDIREREDEADVHARLRDELEGEGYARGDENEVIQVAENGDEIRYDPRRLA